MPVKGNESNWKTILHTWKLHSFRRLIGLHNLQAQSMGFCLLPLPLSFIICRGRRALSIQLFPRHDWRFCQYFYRIYLLRSNSHEMGICS